MPMWRRTVALIALGAAGAVVGSAAGLAVSATTLGSARLAVPRCTAAGLDVVANLSAAIVVSVTVSGLPGSCGGGTLQATVNNGLATGSGSASVPVGGGAVTVTLGGAPALTTTVQTDIVVLGP